MRSRGCHGPLEGHTDSGARPRGAVIYACWPRHADLRALRSVGHGRELDRSSPSGFEWRRAAKAQEAREEQGTKKPRTMPGLLSCRKLSLRSVLRDHRAGPVEAIDQRGADGLDEGLEGRHIRRQSAAQTRNEGFRQGDAVIVSRAVLGLHEPAGSRDTENVQVVFDAATNEKAVTGEGGRGEHRNACERDGI